jgi:hypothetical protein
MSDSQPRKAGKPASPDSERHIVFVNAERVDVPVGASALDAVRAWRSDAAAGVESGAKRISDARGLPIDASTSCYGGAIYRVIGPARASATPDESPGE